MPLPVDPLLLLMLMTILVPSCGASRHAGSGRVLVGERRRYEVERVLEVVVAIPASMIDQTLCVHQHKEWKDIVICRNHGQGCVGLGMASGAMFPEQVASPNSRWSMWRGGLARIYTVSAKPILRVVSGLSTTLFFSSSLKPQCGL